MNESDRSEFYAAEEELNALLGEIFPDGESYEAFSDELEIKFTDDPHRGAELLSRAHGRIEPHEAMDILCRVYGFANPNARIVSEPVPAPEILAEFIELVSQAAPLTWVAHQDMQGAQDWEKRAANLLKRVHDEAQDPIQDA